MGDITAFLAFTTLLVVTPGAATAVVVRNVLEDGRRGGVAAAAGAAIGNFSHAVIAALGAAALFARVPLAYEVLRYGGGLYLAYLGGRELIGAWRAKPSIIPGALEARGGRGTAETRRHGVKQGVLTALLNPPVATYYIAVVPSFMPVRDDLLQPRFFAYAAIHVSMAFTAHCTWAVALSALRRVWARPVVRRTLESLTGIALLALARRVLQG